MVKKVDFIGSIIAALVLFTKSTKLLAIFKALKFTKPLVTVISMLISAVAYGLWLGPWFGVGFVAIIFVHEMGHIIALRQRGIETPGPVFIPFLGAAIFVPKMDDRDTEAHVGFGGPLAGTVCALATFAVWYATGSEIMILLTYVGLFINLINMIPISPLDGGRITQAVGEKFIWAGVVALLVFTLIMREPSLLLIWILVLDNFTNLPLKVRPTLSAVITTLMAALMVSGLSSQPWYVSIWDVVLAFGLTCYFYWFDKRRAEDLDLPEVDLRPAASYENRRKWLVCYVGLTALLAGLLYFTMQHLPGKVHADAATMSAPEPEKK